MRGKAASVGSPARAPVAQMHSEPRLPRSSEKRK
jgi:hypothetical protein